ncbi:MAG: hypothetical protein ACOY4K_09380 [Pseudomonadota bacterium]
MTKLACAVVATAFLAGPAVAMEFEGLSRDDFAAWSYGVGSVQVNGSVRTLAVKAIYNTPTRFSASTPAVTYSIHNAAIDCAARTTTFISGENYGADGEALYPASPGQPTPWSAATPGLLDFVTQVCATDWTRM